MAAVASRDLKKAYGAKDPGAIKRMIPVNTACVNKRPYA